MGIVSVPPEATLKKHALPDEFPPKAVLSLFKPLRLIEVSELHPVKQLGPIVVALDKSTEVSAVQVLNAAEFALVHPVKVAEVRDARLRNPLELIVYVVIESANTSLPTSE